MTPPSDDSRARQTQRRARRAIEDALKTMSLPVKPENIWRAVQEHMRGDGT